MVTLLDSLPLSRMSFAVTSSSTTTCGGQQRMSQEEKVEEEGNILSPYLVELPPSCHLEGSGGAGVKDLDQLGNNPMDLGAVESGVRVREAEVTP